jgi:hypothetical protein
MRIGDMKIGVAKTFMLPAQKLSPTETDCKVGQVGRDVICCSDVDSILDLVYDPSDTGLGFQPYPDSDDE